MTSTETTEQETEATEQETEATTETEAEGDAAATETAEGAETGGRTRGLRQRAQEAEQRVEALEAIVAGYQRAEVTEAARAAGMHDGADLFAHRELSTLLTEDGTVDREALGSALEELRNAKRHLFRGRPAPDHSMGSSATGRAPSSPSMGEAWQSVLSGRQ